MIVLRLTKDMNVRLGALAKLKRRSKSKLVHEAIRCLLDDADDIELARRAKSTTRSARPLKLVRDEFRSDQRQCRIR